MTKLFRHPYPLQQRDYFYARRQTDGIPLEASPPVESWTSATLGGVLLIVFILGAFFLAAVAGAN